MDVENKGRHISALKISLGLYAYLKQAHLRNWVSCSSELPNYRVSDSFSIKDTIASVKGAPVKSSIQ